MYVEIVAHCPIQSNLSELLHVIFLIIFFCDYVYLLILNLKYASKNSVGCLQNDFFARLGTRGTGAKIGKKREKRALEAVICNHDCLLCGKHSSCFVVKYKIGWV